MKSFIVSRSERRNGMIRNLKKLESHALNLPLKERAQLAEYLIDSLDVLDDAENERLWVEEAERRYRQYKRGNIPSRLARDVFRDARDRIK